MPRKPEEETVTKIAAIGLSPFSPGGQTGHQPYDMSSALSGFVYNTVAGVTSLVRGIGDNKDGPGPASPPDSSAVIVRGNPPLTADMLNRSTRGAAVAYGRALSTEEQERYSAYVKAAWTRGIRPAIEVQLALMAAANSLTQREAVQHIRQFMNACGISASAPETTRS